MQRNHRTRALGILAAVGAGALALSACSGGGGTTGGSDPNAAPQVEGGPFGSFPDAALTLSRWAGDPWTSGQQTAADEWNESTGGDLTLDAIPYENLHDKQALALSSGSDFDIVYVHPSWFGEFAEAGYLAPIDDYLADCGTEPRRLLGRVVPARRARAGRVRRQAVLPAGLRVDDRHRLPHRPVRGRWAGCSGDPG